MKVEWTEHIKQYHSFHITLEWLAWQEWLVCFIRMH